MKFETEWALQEWQNVERQFIDENGNAYPTTLTNVGYRIAELNRLVGMMENEISSVAKNEECRCHENPD